MSKFQCPVCGKEDSRKFNHDRHLEICKHRAKFILKNYKRLEAELERKNRLIEQLQLNTKEPVSNNTGSWVFDPERLCRVFKLFTLKQGLVVFYSKYVVRENDVLLYHCGDTSRKIFYFMDKNGKRKKDIGCVDLIQHTKLYLEKAINRYRNCKLKECWDRTDCDEYDTSFEYDQLKETLKEQCEKPLLKIEHPSFVKGIIQTSIH